MKDKSVAYKADNEGKTALHVASTLGRVNIMQELISKCPGCCELVDNRGWNVLHFAATSKTRNAVGLILQNPSLGNLINEKDENRNTPFLQAASKHFIMIHSKVDKLVFNNDDHNASHMVNQLAIYPWKSLLDFPLWHFISDRVKGCQRMVSKNDINDGEEKESKNDPVSSKSNNGTEKNSLVASTLIATVTFTAGFTVPGGFVADKGPDQGDKILTRNTAFRAFIVLNSISMFLSSYAVFYQVSSKPTTRRRQLSSRLIFRHTLISYAMMAMMGAFASGTIAVLHSEKNLSITAVLVPFLLCVFYRLSLIIRTWL